MTTIPNNDSSSTMVAKEHVLCVDTLQLVFILHYFTIQYGCSVKNGRNMKAERIFDTIPPILIHSPTTILIIMKPTYPVVNGLHQDHDKHY